MNGFVAIFRKELTQMLRDRGTVMFALAVPVFQLILFGVIDMNAKHIPTIVFDQSRSQESRQLLDQFEATSYMRIVGEVPSRAAMQREIVAGHAQIAIEIPPDYARNMAAGRKANILILIDGSDSSVSSQALSAANGVILQKDLQDILAKTGRGPMIEGHPIMMFNPDSRSANLLIPGLVAILLTFSGTMLSSFAIVKERERGTLEQLMVTPVSPLAVVLGKVLPYMGLAYMQLILVLILMNVMFQVPIHGSIPLLLSLSSVYLLALLSLGLLISSRAKTQMEAIQQAQMFLLPSIFLSGYVFPSSSLPVPLQVISRLLPATHFIKIARGIIIRGATFTDLWPNVLALLIISVVLIAASARAFQKTIA
ncbi:MAG TPA: ABC transporter permease [Thermoanaerobaculia bacterium]|nr:ABC transporter permease [Thermoanaerobaculia bacterium]